jgi:hypothetical protein
MMDPGFRRDDVRSAGTRFFHTFPNLKFEICNLKCRLERSGQAMSELVIILPLLVVLAGGAIAISYMCWQGIKTQQAANLAARIQGQERVAGGTSASDINNVNGLGMGGDQDPSALAGQDYLTAERAQNLRPQGGAMSVRSVYGKFRDAARSFFSVGERDHVFVPPPVLRSITDQVKVVRVMTPPKIFDFQLKPILVEATAYGGECTNMYSLPCWGHTGANTGSGDLYWQQLLSQNKGNDSSPGLK